MALKGDRNYNDGVDISFFMDTTGERGGIVVAKTVASGAGMDNADAVVLYPTGDPSGEDNAVGLLLNDVVNYDLTKRHINKHRDEVQIGSKVAILRRGTVVTDMISGTPDGYKKAYFNSAGQLTETDTGTETVGKFLSKKDSDGYAKVEINIA